MGPFGRLARWPFLLALLFSSACERACGHSTSAEEGAATASAPRLRVPRISSAIKLDGELDEWAWRRAARTGPFIDRASGEEARPYSDARLLHDGRFLYLGLYAADENIVATAKDHDTPLGLDDAFSIHLQIEQEGPVYAIDVSASGVVADAVERAQKIDQAWESGLHERVDFDGTLNDPSDDDEEWIVEAALPFASLGDFGSSPPRTIFARISRCDTPKEQERRCGAWGDGGGVYAPPSGVLVLE